MEPLRVLHVCGIMNRGGLETLIMNIYRSIDRSVIQFDFLVHSEKKGSFDEEIKQLGGRIYSLPYVTKVGHFAYVKALEKFFERHNKYRIIHSHFNAMSGLVLRAAKKAGIPIRIAHSHNTRYGVTLIENIYKNVIANMIPRNTTHYFACSQKAGEKLFGKKIGIHKLKVIKNGVCTNLYQNNLEIKQAARKKLGIDQGAFVVGHVGRFQIQKNHTFLIDVFAAVKERRPKSVLLLVGDGPLRAEMQQKVIDLGIKDSVCFLGVRSDVPEIMQAMDVFAFPSLFEGLPVTLVEAQASGLHCIISDTITKEVDMGAGLITYQSINDKKKWIDSLLEPYPYRSSEECVNIVRNSGYDILDSATWLQKFYIDAAR